MSLAPEVSPLQIESLLDQADEKFFEELQQQPGNKIPSYALDQYRKIREDFGRSPEGNPPPVDIIGNPPKHFIDFINQYHQVDTKTLLYTAGKLSRTQIIIPDSIPAAKQTLYIEGLEVHCMTRTDFGVTSLIFCDPFLPEVLKETNIDEDDPNSDTLEERIRKLLGTLKIHYVLADTDETHRYRDKMIGNEKAQILSFKDFLNATEFPSLEPIINNLELIGLYPLRRPEDKIRQNQVFDHTEILDTIRNNKNKDEISFPKTEWESLTTSRNLPFLNIENSPLTDELTKALPVNIQNKFGIYPLSRVRNLVTVAAYTLPKVQRNSEIRNSLPGRSQINYVLASKTTLLGLIQAAQSKYVDAEKFASKIKTRTHEGGQSAERIDISELAKRGKDDEATVVELVQALLLKAVDYKASDLHISEHPGKMWVRYRIDGELVPFPTPLPPELTRPCIARIKHMADIDTQHSSKPQNGKFITKIGDLNYEIRVATANTFISEKVVMRLQAKSTQIPTLEQLGFLPFEKSIITKAIDADHGLLILCGPTGAGKCLGKGTPVLKYNGEIVPIEQIKEGDILMGPDSTPRKVLKTNQGKGPLYEIQPNKGEPWVCNDVHVMTLRQTAPNMSKPSVLGDRRKRNEGIYQGFGIKAANQSRTPLDKEYPEIIDVPLNEFLERTPPTKNPSQHWKLFRTGVQFQTSPEVKEIPPEFFYYAGLWLGDGSIRSNEITNEDLEIITWIEEFSTKRNYRFLNEEDKRKTNVKTLAAKPPTKGGNCVYDPSYPFFYQNIATKAEGICLRTFLACFAESSNPKKLIPVLKSARQPKKIPSWAKTATEAQRWQLLAGILDSDASLSTKNYFELLNKSKPLVTDTIFLARSLGLWAQPEKEKPVKDAIYWRTTISGDIHKIPNKIERKKAKARTSKKNVLNTGWKPKSIGEGEYYGFTLDKDGRFLLGDFTVTHNTTTLYATIGMVDRTKYNVVTAEDPVEIYIQNTEQTPIKEGLTFSAFIPEVLRQDPDYIMIGETRDMQTAEEVIRASITGHVVLTTLHTNSSYEAPARLIDLGAKPYLIADALAGVCAQRLVRRLCQNCMQQVNIPGTRRLRELEIKEEWLLGREVIYEPIGCKLCRGTGYSGRIGIIEGFVINQDIRKAINAGAQAFAIKEAMEAQGGKTLFQHAVENAARGICSLTDCLAIHKIGT